MHILHVTKQHCSQQVVYLPQQPTEGPRLTRFWFRDKKIRIYNGNSAIPRSSTIFLFLLHSVVPQSPQTVQFHITRFFSGPKMCVRRGPPVIVSRYFSLKVLLYYYYYTTPLLLVSTQGFKFAQYQLVFVALDDSWNSIKISGAQFWSLLTK